MKRNNLLLLFLTRCVFQFCNTAGYYVTTPQIIQSGSGRFVVKEVKMERYQLNVCTQLRRSYRIYSRCTTFDITGGGSCILRTDLFVNETFFQSFIFTPLQLIRFYGNINAQLCPEDKEILREQGLLVVFRKCSKFWIFKLLELSELYCFN